ncbi:MAG: DNA recombination protein RmuC [Vicinamibacterales bacterium]
MDPVSVLAVILALVAGFVAGWLLASRTRRQHEQGLRDSFQALAGDALRSSTDEFLKLADQKIGNVHKEAAADLGKRQQALDALVSPIKDTLTLLGATLQDTDRHRTADSARLQTLLEQVGLTQQKLRLETENLVRALRSPGVRGRWGEVQLKRVVELAGMLEHCDFSEQPTAISDTGRLRPDLTVNLPGGHTIVVDAKAPLEAFLDAQAATDPGVRSGKLADHVRQVREHVSKLGAKGYWEQFSSSPDFVVLFLPTDAIFLGALEQDAQLIEFGVKERVLIASPLTLIALLRAAALGWRQEHLTINAEEISKLGRELYERARVFTDRLDGIGSKLDATVRAYNEAVGTYDTRVMVSMRRFKDLGAATGDDIQPVATVDSATRKVQSASQQDLLDAAIIEGEVEETRS